MSTVEMGEKKRKRSSAAMALPLFAVACLLATSPASAQHAGGARGTLKDTSTHDRPMMLSLFTGLNYRRGFSNNDFPMVVAGRFYVPIVHDGFIPRANDEFGIEFGADMDIYIGGNVFGLGFPVAVMWDFHFTEFFDAYAKAGFIVGNDFINRRNSNTAHDFWWGFHGAAGIRMRLTDWLYFRVEGGYPVVMAGLGFAF